MRKINRAWRKSNHFWRWSEYISMPKFRPFPSWLCSQEKPQKPQIWPVSVEMVPKGEKSTDRDWNLISFEGREDTSTCQNSGHASHVDQFHQVKVAPKWSESRDYNLISSEGGQDISTCNISVHSFHLFPEKCLETPNLICFTKSKWCKRRKIDTPWPKSNQFWRWSGYISMPNCRPFFNSLSGKCLETSLNEWTDRWTYRP